MTHTPDLAVSFTTLGGLLIAGLAAQWLGQRTAIPRVTLLIGLGVAAGPTGADLISGVASQTFPWISHITLAMVGFLLGGKLHLSFLRSQGEAVFTSSVWVTLCTWAAVALGCGLLTGDWPLALIMGAIATATDPAATHDVIRESGVQNTFTDRLLGIVSLDDVWGLLLFSVSVTIAGFMLDTHLDAALRGLWELVGAIGLGLVIGLPVAWLTARSSSGEPLLIEALGAVILCAGLAEAIHVSYLLACIMMGATVTNVARHHNRPFHAIEQIEWPFMMLFFILAGASLDIEVVAQLGWLGIAYVVCRIAGRLLGGMFCCWRQHWSPREGLSLGKALLPQAGVAIGIALIGSQAFPAYADQLLTTAIAGTVIFEVLGPPLTRHSVRQMMGN
jgi:Kef-type K+ transport system membrane component KefB